jgi:ATP-dependent helicase/nuclease subunit B
MAIRFILGTSGSGKTRWCVDAIAAALREGGTEPLVFLVPEQATFQAERAILSCAGISGYSRLQVLSFNRLQFRLCRGGMRSELTPLGRQMLVRQALSSCAGSLQVLGPSVATAGMVAALANLIRRLYEDNCAPDGLEAAARGILTKDPQNLTGRKFADIALVFRRYLDLLSRPGREFLNPDALLTEARAKVKDTAFLKGARLWIDGFSGFTLQQRELLFEMLSVCRGADIALCLDPRAMDLNDTDPEELDPASLFAPTERTYVDLLAILRNRKMSVTEPALLARHPRFESAPALAHIEQNFFLPEAKAVPAGDAIEIRGLADIRAEAFFIAGQIRRLVREQKLRYRDIAIIAPDIHLYAHYLAGAFEQYKIPYFLDRPQALQSHPLMELLIGALRAAQSGFALSSMSAMLKVDWNGVDSLEADTLDNYCRAFGVGRDDWASDAPWDLGGDEPSFMPERINALRKKFFAPFGTLAGRLQGSITARQGVAAIEELLERLHIRQKLAEESQKDPQDNQFSHRRVWKKMQETFEELTDVFGDDAIPASEMTIILLDVFLSLTLKQIPPAADEVLIGSIERSRHPEIKVAFLPGATQKLFPVPLAQDALLTEEDTQCAAKEKLLLTQPLEQALSARRYLAYIALTRASERLYITFPLSDEKESATAPWPGLERLCELCDGLHIQYGSPAELSQPWNVSIPVLAEWFCAALGPESDCDEKTKSQAMALLSCFKASGDSTLAHLCGDVEYALSYRNEAKLEETVISQMAGGPLKTSASRLTSFATCPYQYFARYVLRLKKRDLTGLKPVDIGDFYHEILRRLFMELYGQGFDWTNAAEVELMENCQRIAGDILRANSRLSAFVRGGAYNAYIIRQAVSGLAEFLPSLAAMSAAGQFRQKAAEVEFGKDDPPVAIEIGKGKSIHLRGKIDRIDCADIDGQWTGIVFDYKTGSSTTKLSWTKFYHGLDLQLAAYLLALRHQVIANRPIEQVAGAFYLPIERVLDKADLTKLQDETSPAVKARGMFDGRFASELENVPAGEYSRFYGFSVDTKENQPYSRYSTSDAVKPEEFSSAMRFAEEKIRMLGRGIVSGNIHAFPYRLGTQSPCSHCDYRPVCKFDWQLNEYHFLSSMNKAGVLIAAGGGTCDDKA